MYISVDPFISMNGARRLKRYMILPILYRSFPEHFNDRKQ